MPVTTDNLLRAIRRLIWGDANMTEFAQDVAAAFKSTATLIDAANAAIAAAGSGGGAVSSVFGRTGAVVAVGADYVASQITNDSGVAGTNVDDALDALGAALTVVTPYYGTWASLPAAGTAGRVAYITNSPQSERVDSGTAWRPVIRGVLGTQPPLAASFTKLNATTATLSDNNGCLQMVSALAGTNEAWSYGVAPAATFKCSMAFMGQWVDGGAGSEGEFGIIARESGSGKFYLLACYATGTVMHIQAIRYSAINTSAGGGTDVVASLRVPTTGSPIWLRIVQDATNLIHQYSNSGWSDDSQWTTLFTEAKAAYATVNQVGLFTNRTAGLTIKADVYHFDLS